MAAPPAFNAVVQHPSASLHGCCRRRLTEHRAHAPHTLPASWAISALTIQTDRGTRLRGHTCCAVICCS